MYLQNISISSFRNLRSVQLELPTYGYCLISGPNGSGKTSLLEAIYTLCCGKSFRTSDVLQLIQNQHESFTLFATLQPGGANLGVERSRQGRMLAKYMGEVTKFSEIARMLPVRILSPIESYVLINGGPEQRRRFLDWGMFHVKHFYWAELQKLHRILKQKSAALKMRCSEEELMQWNHMLAEVSYSLDKLREEYLTKLTPIFLKYQQKLPILREISLTYYPGWERESTDLPTQLSTAIKQERQQGHCLLGPHRAEIRLETQNGLCKDQLSRGRQKTLAIALYLAQGDLLFQEAGRYPLYMIDDFSSELDTEAQQLLIEALEPLNKQVIITHLDDQNPFLANISTQHDLRRYFLRNGQLTHHQKRVPGKKTEN